MVKMTSENQDGTGVTPASDIAVMIEAKDRGDGSRRTLFTVEHFKEMIELENFILSLTAPEDLVDKIKP